MTEKLGIAAIFSSALFWLAASPSIAADVEAPVRSTEILSRPYTIDRKYRSMSGPQGVQRILLPSAGGPEVLWITGYSATVVGPDGASPRWQEFMCHTNLDLDMRGHERLFGWRKTASDRLFTLSQGQQAVEFPKGFGIPVLSNEPLSLTTQVLNLNTEGAAFDVRHRVKIDYVRDRDLVAPMKPLFMKAAAGLKLLEGRDGHYGAEGGDEHGDGCMVGQQASTEAIADQHGRRFTGHWKVSPGVEVNHTPVTRYLDLPYDTTVHYIAVHLHPFAEPLALRDVTANEIVFESRARGFGDKLGLERVEHYASEQGIALYQDHEYELVSTYDNTSGAEQDSMAVMFLYLLEKDYKKPASIADTGQSISSALPAMTSR
ncbi:MAG: hypothetical protein ACREQQ_03835 [Candidatus Binatia bacterium]